MAYPLRQIVLSISIIFLRYRRPWFDTSFSYNPAIHRVKQAMFHCAIVNDIATHPLPPPHPELTQYFEPPAKLVKKAQPSIDACKLVFNAREGNILYLLWQFRD